MKVCGTSSSQPSSGERQDEPATPRPDRLRRGREAGLPARRPTAGGMPRDAQPGLNTSVDRAEALRSQGQSEERSKEDLGGEQNPWKEEVFQRRKRRGSTSDSSVEQGLEVGCSATDLAGTAHQQWTSHRPGESSPSSGAASAARGRCSEKPLLGVDHSSEWCGPGPRLASGSRVRDPRVGCSATGGLRAVMSGLPSSS